jgi:hypothetical protein
MLIFSDDIKRYLKKQIYSKSLNQIICFSVYSTLTFNMKSECRKIYNSSLILDQINQHMSVTRMKKKSNNEIKIFQQILFIKPFV